MTSCFDAILYDGESSAPHQVIVNVASDGRLLIEQFPDLWVYFSQLEIKPRVGNTARHLHLPDGQLLESHDNDAIDELCDQWAPIKESVLHRLEHNLKLVWFSLIALVALGYSVIVYGIPLLSAQITDRLPISVDIKMAEHALTQMDQFAFTPSNLTAERQIHLEELFYSLLPQDERHYQLVFRNAEIIGANAFALPDGTVVMTDQLVNLADDGTMLSDTLSDKDTMLASILLHEIGHVKYRHAVQNTVRQAGFSALILIFTGDVGTASSLVLLLPTVLMQANYSKEFEWQSDGYALAEMQARGMDTNAFADIMQKMVNAAEVKAESATLLSYFSSHPPTHERIQRFRTPTSAENDGERD